MTFALSRLARSLALAGVLFSSLAASAANTDSLIDALLQAASTKTSAKIEESKQAVERADKPLPKDPALSKKLNTEAISASKNGDIDAAIKLFKEAREADMSSASAANNLCLAYLRAKNYPEAVAAGKAAIGLVPANERIWYNLGQAYGANGMYSQAASSFYLAQHFSAEPEKVREQLVKLSGTNNAGMAAAAKIALDIQEPKPETAITQVEAKSQLAPTANSAPATRTAVQAAPSQTAPAAASALVAQAAKNEAPSPKIEAPSSLAAKDIAGIASLNLKGEDIPDPTKKYMDLRTIFHEADLEFHYGYGSKDKDERFAKADLPLRRAAFLGHKDAPGMLGILLSQGYTAKEGGRKPDLEEAKKLFALSNTRGGYTGYWGQALEAEKTNPLLAIQLHEKSLQIEEKYDSKKSLVMYTLESKDPAVVEAAKAAIKRTKITDDFIKQQTLQHKVKTGEIILKPAPDTAFDNAICTILQDQVTNARRSGNQAAFREAQFKIKLRGCN